MKEKYLKVSLSHLLGVFIIISIYIGVYGPWVTGEQHFMCDDNACPYSGNEFLRLMLIMPFAAGVFYGIFYLHDKDIRLTLPNPLYWLRRLVYTPAEPSTIVSIKDQYRKIYGTVNDERIELVEPYDLPIYEYKFLCSVDHISAKYCSKLSPLQISSINARRAANGLSPLPTLNPAVPERKTEPPAPPAEPNHTSKG